MQPAIALVAILVIGIFVGRALHPKPPPLIIQRVNPSVPVSSITTPQATVIEEEVYICGARTKKGTPCSRRVHGPVRCWQHKGQKPMLPQEKLLVKD